MNTIITLNSYFKTTGLSIVKELSFDEYIRITSRKGIRFTGTVMDGSVKTKTVTTHTFIYEDDYEETTVVYTFIQHFE